MWTDVQPNAQITEVRSIPFSLSVLSETISLDQVTFYL